MIRNITFITVKSGINFLVFLFSFFMIGMLILTFVMEILEFIFPQYTERRGWSEEFVEKLYAEALKSLYHTKYVIVREKGLNGKIIACMGLTRAPYGKVVYYNKLTQQWEERIGPFGKSFLADKFSINNLQAAKDHYQHPNWWQWPAPILSFEKNLDPSNRLPRPGILEEVVTADKFPSDAFTDYFVGQQVDVTKPIYFYRGQLLEPTKFGVAKNSDLRGVAYAEVLLQLFKAVFHEDEDFGANNSFQSADFALNGQALYTYNDRTGIPLYRSMGLETMTELGIQVIGGIKFTTLQMLPITMLKKLSDPAFGERRLPIHLINYFSNYYQQIVEQENTKNSEHELRNKIFGLK